MVGEAVMPAQVTVAAVHDDSSTASAPEAALPPAAAPVFVAEPTPPMAAVPAPAPVVAPVAAHVAAPAAMPQPVRVEPYALPTDTLHSLAAAAGLQWVNSDADKIRAVREAMAAEPAPIRVPREPRRQVLVDDGPLVLVETKKDLSQLKLPFDSSAHGAAAS